MQWTTYSSYLQLLNDLDWERIRVVVLCGLPGSGKSSLGAILQESLGYKYVSSDIARVEVMKLTESKFCTNEEYAQNTKKVYAYMREQLAEAIKQKTKITLDATHLNEQRAIALSMCLHGGLVRGEVLVIYVDAGERENVRARFLSRRGQNKDGRSWETAWAEAYDYFVKKINNGEIKLPKNNEKGYKVVWVRNY